MSNKNQSGLTLIEVLIALAILSIALTAIVKSSAQNIQNGLYLQNKTIATWVGVEVINEVRANVLMLPKSSDGIEKETSMLGREWPWHAYLTETPNAHIQKVNVDVFLKSNHNKLIHLESYIYEAT